ncbi:MAG: class I SAM-dependent methyltransferase [Solirubrobacterales bacterium]
MESSPTTIDAERVREVNIRYHDAAADGYDAKWGIDYGEVGIDQVLMKLGKALGRAPRRFPRALEIGAGTGYFTLNLLRGRAIERAVATDISQGMLDRLTATADDLGLDVATVCCDAEQLPFEDDSFDIVFGHAVLHHIPRLDRALAEFHRVLAPGGVLVFMGEPSRYGDRMATLPKRAGALAAPIWRRLMRAQDGVEDGRLDHDHALEQLVDVHTFSPVELRALATEAGFEQVRVCGEELVANLYGWAMRSLEAGTDPTSVPHAWHVLAFRGYLALQWVDTRMLEPRLPAELFYNLLVSARKSH